MSMLTGTVDWALVLESLEWTKRKFQDYDGYPSYEFKRQRIREVEDTISALRQHIKALKARRTREAA